MFPFSDSDTCLQVNLLWRILEYSTTELYLFNSRLLPARISIFDQNQEAEIFKFRWCRQSEFKNQLNLTSKILTRMLHITNINLCVRKTQTNQSCGVSRRHKIWRLYSILRLETGVMLGVRWCGLASIQPIVF